MLTVPHLQTERLTLVPLAAAHSDGMFALWSQPDVGRYSGLLIDYDGKPIPSPCQTSEDSDRLLQFWLKACAAGWGFRWALMMKPADIFIGIAGFNSLGDISEYAYHLHPDYWGRGLMSEATEAALKWRLLQKECSGIEVHIEPDNLASIRLAERFGFERAETLKDGSCRYLMPASGSTD